MSTDVLKGLSHNTTVAFHCIEQNPFCYDTCPTTVKRDKRALVNVARTVHYTRMTCARLMTDGQSDWARCSSEYFAEHAFLISLINLPTVPYAHTTCDEMMVQLEFLG